MGALMNLGTSNAPPPPVPPPSVSAEHSAVIEAASGENQTSDELADAWSMLDVMRKESIVPGEPDMKDMFSMQILAGQWSLARSSRLISGLRTDAKVDSLPHRFGKHFGLPVSASFDRGVYGDASSNALAELWRCQMAHLARHWQSEDCPEHFNTETLPELVLTPALQESLSMLADEAMRRRDQIKDL
eukprot:6477780-Amphidinium_carterae.1